MSRPRSECAVAIDETIPPNARGAARSKRGNQGQTRHQQLLMCLRAAADGDFSVRVPAPPEAGIDGDIARAFNALVSRTEALTQELVRVERVVGREGRMNELVTLGPVTGGWSLGVSSINALIGDLVQPTTEVARVISAVA